MRISRWFLTEANLFLACSDSNISFSHMLDEDLDSFPFKKWPVRFNMRCATIFILWCLSVFGRFLNYASHALFISILNIFTMALKKPYYFHYYCIYFFLMIQEICNLKWNEIAFLKINKYHFFCIQLLINWPNPEFN